MCKYFFYTRKALIFLIAFIHISEHICLLDFILPIMLLLLLSHFSLVRLCATDPIDGSPPGSAVPGILQARTLEWVATSFSSAWKWKVKVKSLSHVRLLATPWTAAYQAPPPMGFSRQEYWSGVPLPSPLLILLVGKSSRWLMKRTDYDYWPEKGFLIIHDFQCPCYYILLLAPLITQSWLFLQLLFLHLSILLLLVSVLV